MANANAICVQTTDLPLLIEYISDVLTYCLEQPRVRATPLPM